MDFLDTLFSGSFMTTSQMLVSGVVAFVVWLGYKKNIFLSRFAAWLMVVEIALVVVFLTHQTLSGHVAEEATHEAYYAIVGMVHGILSLFALIYTVFSFMRARTSYKNGQNYFFEHTVRSVVLVGSWFAALLTGLFL